LRYIRIIILLILCLTLLLFTNCRINADKPKTASGNLENQEDFNQSSNNSQGSSTGPVYAAVIEDTGESVTAYPQQWATGDGTESNPWAGDCIKTAYDNCPVGGIIFLEAGYYILSDVVTITKAINIIGEGIGKTIITTADAHGFSSDEIDYISIKNLTIAEEKLSLSKAKKILFGGDGDSWIISGVDDYFPSATYLLCFYHLFKRLREGLGRRKEEQKTIKDLLLSNQTDKALSKIEQMIRTPYNQREKDNLTKFYTYISRNRQGIANQVILKGQEIQRTGAIESNINKVITSRFKKRGMSWSKPGALALLKIKETILNNEWNNWWETERERNIKVGKYKPPLPAAHFNKETESSPIVEVTIPALRGPDQGKPWVGVLRKLSEVGYY